MLSSAGLSPVFTPRPGPRSLVHGGRWLPQKHRRGSVHQDGVLNEHWGRRGGCSLSLHRHSCLAAPLPSNRPLTPLERQQVAHPGGSPCLNCAWPSSGHHRLLGSEPVGRRSPSLSLLLCVCPSFRNSAFQISNKPLGGKTYKTEQPVPVRPEPAGAKAFAASADHAPPPGSAAPCRFPCAESPFYAGSHTARGTLPYKAPRVNAW